MNKIKVINQGAGVKVLERGTKIKIKNVDLYGLLGRELHPKKAHEGLKGEIINAIEINEDDGYIIYSAYIPAIDGYLDLADYEIKKCFLNI